MPIKIPFIAEVRDFLRGSGNVEEALDDVAGSLDDLARDAKRSSDESGRALDDLGDDAKTAGREVERAGQESETALESISDHARDAGRDLERRITDAAEEAGREAEDMGREFQTALDSVSDRSKRAGDDLDRHTTRGFRAGGEAVGEFRDEAKQNFSEVASSFTGEMDSAVDLVQGTLGGLATSIPGGVGLALAGLGAAAGVFYTQWNENAEKTEARIESMYEDMAQSGRDYLSAEFVNQGISDILNDSEDAAIDFARAQEIARESGIELGTVLRAFAGDAESAREVNGSLTDSINDLTREAENSSYVNSPELTEARVQLGEYRDQLTGVTDATDTAGDRAAAYRDAQVTSTEATREYTEALAGMDDAAASAAEQIATNNDTISDQTARTVENNAVLAGYAGELIDVQDAAREAGATTSELNALQSTQYQRFLDTARAAGIEAGEARDLAEELGLIPGNVNTNVNVDDHGDVNRVQDDIDGIHGTDVGVGVRLNDSQIQSDVYRMIANVHVPPIKAPVRIGSKVL